MRYSYYAQPWSLVSDMCREVRAIVIRGLYGWHYSDSWSADRYILRLVSQLIRQVQAHHDGVPLYFCDGGDPTTVQVVNEAVRLAGIHVADAAPDALARSDAAYSAWLDDKAQACEQWLQLLDDGPFGHLYDDVWSAQFDQVWHEQGLEAAFNLDAPLDRLSDDEYQQLIAQHHAAFAATCARLHDLIDHLDVVSD